MASKYDLQKDEIKERATASFLFFIRLVQPQRVLGGIHEEIISWVTRDGAGSHQLILLPRDHQKSAIAGLWTAWQITRNPAIRILYISSTANLAVKQLKFIKDILTSPIYRRYWPEMVNQDEGKREKWTETEISVDHPLRKAEVVRDPTVFTAGLTTNIVGMHSDKSVFDDTVTDDTAYTEEGRQRLKRQYSLLASIEGTNAGQLVVGTRYHPKDLYHDCISMEVADYDDEGNELPSYQLYEVFERVVEDSPMRDGSGQFLWPQQRRYDGKLYGFNRKILERKRAQYLDQTQFMAQYYNDPNDISSAGINTDHFQYFERSHLSRSAGRWFYQGRRLNVYAAIDFAYSLRPEADFSSIVVVGVDGNQNYYILDIDRFKTKLMHEYYQHILTLHQKWDFRKLRAEINVAQTVIVDDLKLNYIRRDGLALSVEDVRPSGKEGKKATRIFNTLQPRYANLQMWHYRGGNCQILEEELVLQNPAHDDVKDALATVIPMCVAPTLTQYSTTPQVNIIHPRFGGVA